MDIEDVAAVYLVASRALISNHILVDLTLVVY
jgi:hypothetical protein